MAASPSNPKQDPTRKYLVEALRGGSAHLDPRTALAGIPASIWGKRPDGAPHSAWELLEHLRFTLHDLLAFSTDPAYVAPDWPGDYWPVEQAPPDPAAVRHSIDRFFADLDAFTALVENPQTDLDARIPWGEGQTILREALLAIDHNSYHLGQLVMVGKILASRDRLVFP